MNFDDLDDDAVWDFLSRRLTRREDWSAFLTGENSARIKAVLTAHLVDVQNELASRAAAHAAAKGPAFARGPAGRAEYRQQETEYLGWRSRALNYQQQLQFRISQVRQVYDDYRHRRHQEGEAFRTRYERDTIRVIALAIAKHQAATARLDLEPSKADFELWGTLDTITVPYGAGQATLSQMIDRHWTDGTEASG